MDLIGSLLGDPLGAIGDFVSTVLDIFFGGLPSPALPVAPPELPGAPSLPGAPGLPPLPPVNLN